MTLSKYEDYIKVFDALSHPARIKIVGILSEGRLVTSSMKISDSGKAVKYYVLEKFHLNITSELLHFLSQDIVIESAESK